MWTYTEERQGINKAKGCYGSVIGKINKSSFLFSVDWWDYRIKKRLSTIQFYISIKLYKKFKKEIDLLFRELILLVDGIYGYITDKGAQARQHVVGTLETRIPGVFWCNYFGKLYVDFFTEEKVLSYNWLSTEKLSNVGIITYLSDEPYGDIVLNENLENSAKEHLGSDSFGDVKDEKDDIFYRQIKNVPKID